MKRVLITGASGFIGSHVTEYLLSSYPDIELVLLDRIGSMSGRPHLLHMGLLDAWEASLSRLSFVKHDLRERIGDELIEKIGKCDAVIHLAGRMRHDSLSAIAEDFVLDNVLGAAHLFQVIQRVLADDGKCVVFGSVECYGDSPERVRTENSQWMPTSPYAASKAAAALLGYSLWRQCGHRVIILLATNNFGERQNPRNFIPACAREFSAGGTMHIFTDGAGKPGRRTWMYAKNSADAICHLLRVGASGEIFNVVAGPTLDNAELAGMIAEILGQPARLVMVKGDQFRKGYDSDYRVIGHKLEVTGWRAPYEFKAALEQTVRWYADHPDWGRK